MFRTYALAPFEPVHLDYHVTAQGETIPVSPARVSAMAVDQIYRGKQRPLDETEVCGYVRFSGDGPVDMTVKAAFDVFRAAVSPLRYGIRVRRQGRVMRFTLPEPGYYTLEVNGVHKPLHIFYDPPEQGIPNPDDRGVLYFGAGVHNVGVLALHSHETLYLEGGARLMGCVTVDNAEDVRICGRGVIDASLLPRETNANAIRVLGSKNVRIEGVVLQDAPVYALTVGGGHDVTVDHVKIIGQWRYNSDGIDLHNIQSAYVGHCFVRTFDDSVVIKGVRNIAGHDTGHMSVSDILVEKCVIWNDWGRALEIGAETSAEAMNGITFRDCDVAHFSFIACDVQACGDAPVRDIVFDDIRVGEPLDPQCEPRLCEIFIRPMCWIKGDTLGSVGNVTFSRIAYQGRTLLPCRLIGYSEESDIQGVRFDGITVNGQALQAGGLDMCPFIVGDHVSGVTVNGEPLDTGAAHYESDAETRESFLIGNGAYISLDEEKWTR